MAAFRALNRRIRSAPLAAAMLIGGAKNFTVDQFIQRFGEEKEEVNWRRSAAFTVFGLAWVGAGQYGVYNVVFPRLLPGVAAQKPHGAVMATLADNFVHMPFFYFPCFYLAKEATADTPLDRKVLDAHAVWRNNFRDDVTNSLSVFLPSQAFNFAINPPHLRVPFAVGVGVLWIGFLSVFRGET